jgi:hypothetical protein
MRALASNLLSNLQRKADVKFVFVGDLPGSGAAMALLVVVMVFLV